MNSRDLDRAQVCLAMSAVLFAVIIAEAEILKAIDALRPGPSGFDVVCLGVCVITAMSLVLYRGRESS